MYLEAELALAFDKPTRRVRVPAPSWGGRVLHLLTLGRTSEIWERESFDTPSRVAHTEAMVAGGDVTAPLGVVDVAYFAGNDHEQELLAASCLPADPSAGDSALEQIRSRELGYAHKRFGFDFLGEQDPASLVGHYNEAHGGARKPPSAGDCGGTDGWGDLDSGGFDGPSDPEARGDASGCGCRSGTRPAVVVSCLLSLGLLGLRRRG